MSYDGYLKFNTKIDSSGFSSGIHKIGSIAKTGLSVIGGFAAGIVGAGSAAAVKIGISFESQMSKVQAISGATGDELSALTEKAKEMGQATKFSATESAQALEYMAMAGWKTEDMLGGIEGVMNLAAASGEDLATTADIVTDSLTAFGMSASESGHFADVLAVASSNANTNVSMMGETFKYVAPVAGALGYSAEDTALAIGLMANSGIKAGQAGTALRAIMSRMAKPTDEVEASMQRLGISLTDSQGNMKSLNEMIKDLRDGFSGLTEAEAAQMAAALGGQEAMSGLLAIVNASDEDFSKLESSIYSCDGAAAQMADTMNNNLQGQLTILKSSAEALGLELYESIQTPLTDIAKSGIEEINKLTQAFRDDGAEGLISAGSDLIANLITGMVDRIPEATDIALGVLGSIASSIASKAPRLISAGKDILQYVYDGMAQMVQSAPDITNHAGKIVSDLMSGIQNAAPQMISSAADLIASFAQGIGEQLPTLVPQAMNMIVTLADAVIANIPKIVQAGVSILVGLVSGIINGLPTLIEEGPRIINEFADAIYNGIGTLLGTGLAMIVELGKGIINNMPLIIQNAGEILKAIINVFSLSSMLNLGKKLIESLAKGMEAVGPAIKTALSNIGKTGLEAIKNLKWSQVGKAIITFISTSLRSGASLAVNALKSVGTLAMNAFKSISWGTVGKAVITGIANGITGAAGAIVTAAKNAAKKALDAAKNFLGIHSPSTVFRDQVGKNMALGMGLGFEKNVPISEISKSLDNAVDDIQLKTLRVRLNSITRSLNESATNGIRAGKTVDDDRSRERQKEDKDPIDYKRLGREMGRRPIYVSAKLNEREVVKMTAKPMKEKMDNDEKIKKMLKGEPVWA